MAFHGRPPTQCPPGLTPLSRNPRWGRFSTGACWMDCGGELEHLAAQLIQAWGLVRGCSRWLTVGVGSGQDKGCCKHLTRRSPWCWCIRAGPVCRHYLKKWDSFSRANSPAAVPAFFLFFSLAPRESCRLESERHMLEGAGAASVDTAPGVCTTDVGVPECQFWAVGWLRRGTVWLSARGRVWLGQRFLFLWSVIKLNLQMSPKPRKKN